MGCDIHVYTEKRGDWFPNGGRCHIDDDDKWHNDDLWKRDVYEKGDLVIEPIYQHRDYVLFTILANVRNYYDNDNVCMDEAKGLPGDVSDIVFKEYTEFLDYHNPSFFTLRELRQHYMKNQLVNYNGIKDEISPLKELIENIEDKKGIKYYEDESDFQKMDNIRIVFWFDN